MYDAYLARIDRAIEEARTSLERELSRLIELKSIYETSSADQQHENWPLEAFVEMGREEGFYIKRYPVGLVRLSLQDGQPDVGIWCRGADGQAGPLWAMFHLLKIFKDLEIPLKDCPALYVGSDLQNSVRGLSESADARDFLPQLSLVPDGIFPVGYGGKGALTIKFRGNKALRDLQIRAGQPEAPGTAEAVLQGEMITFHSPIRPAFNPGPYGNMISLLMEDLLRRPETPLENRLMLEFFKLVSKDVYGKRLCVDAEHEVMGPLTICAREINTVGGYPDLTVEIYYPTGITYGEIVGKLTDAAEKYDVAVVDAHNIAKPYLLKKEQKVIRRLTSLANGVFREETEPYILHKATCANLLPNALVYGMGCEGDDRPSVDHLLKGMKVYARALLTLNEMNWKQDDNRR